MGPTDERPLPLTDAETRVHWEGVFGGRPVGEHGWHQPHLAASLGLIERSELDPMARIIDVGGGASTLVDDLLDRGFGDVTVLDVSPAAFAIAHDRLGERAAAVRWLEADVRQARLEAGSYDLWHDRALFHFLVGAADRRRYVATLRAALKAGGWAIVAAFAPDGPDWCSGLPCKRHSPASLETALGPGFELVETVDETHRAPWGAEQRFVYCRFRYEA